MNIQIRNSYKQAGKIAAITKNLAPNKRSSSNLEYELYGMSKLLVYIPDYDTYPPLYMPRLLYEIVDDKNLRYIKTTHMLKALSMNCFSYASLLAVTFIIFERSFTNFISFLPFLIVAVIGIIILTMLYANATKNIVKKRLEQSQ